MTISPADWHRTRERALSSRGISDSIIHTMVARGLQTRRASEAEATLIDVGCGTGGFFAYADRLRCSYTGVDLIRYDGFPERADFVAANLDTDRIPLPDASGDFVVAIETIEHVENPRAFMRELVRLTSPGGYVIVTTPNQLSLTSKLCLCLRNQFLSFQDTCYPGHISALVESDLYRIASEVNLRNAVIYYSNHGRIPKIGRDWPRFCSGRLFSDNVMLIGHKPE